MGGLAWLFMGVPFSKSLLYDDEDKNAAGQKMYIQTKMAEYKDELWELMQKPNTHIYMCGLEGGCQGNEEGPPLPRGGLLMPGLAFRPDSGPCMSFPAPPGVGAVTGLALVV